MLCFQLLTTFKELCIPAANLAPCAGKLVSVKVFVQWFSIRGRNVRVYLVLE